MGYSFIYILILLVLLMFLIRVFIPFIVYLIPVFIIIFIIKTIINSRKNKTEDEYNGYDDTRYSSDPNVIDVDYKVVDEEETEHLN